MRGICKWGQICPGVALWMIRVNGSPLVAVQAETDIDAFDWLEKEWDEEHGAGDFDKQIVGVRLLQ